MERSLPFRNEIEASFVDAQVSRDPVPDTSRANGLLAITAELATKTGHARLWSRSLELCNSVKTHTEDIYGVLSHKKDELHEDKDLTNPLKYGEDVQFSHVIFASFFVPYERKGI